MPKVGRSKKRKKKGKGGRKKKRKIVPVIDKTLYNYER